MEIITNSFLFSGIVLMIFTKAYNSAKVDVCTAEEFNPNCNQNEIIYIDNAVYGRMAMGPCIETEHFIGCKNDATEIIAKQCSGRSDCTVLVSKGLHRSVPGACEKYVSGYAEFQYRCQPVAAITPDMCHDNGMKLSSRNSLISNMILREKCSNGRLKLVADQGQRINISITEFSGQNNLPLGSITEQRFGNVVYPKTGIKTHHVITSLANELEIDLSRANADVAFLYDVTVLGCVDLTPPVGAWMTRDDNVIEIGCHSGSKTWRLECIDNEWTGVTGNCGFESQAEPKSGNIRIKKAPNVISMDVIAFGVCSLIILLSACIFLAGTLLLKRKVVPPQKLAEYDPLTGNPEMSGNCLTYDPNTASYVLYGNTHK